MPNKTVKTDIQKPLAEVVSQREVVIHVKHCKHVNTFKLIVVKFVQQIQCNVATWFAAQIRYPVPHDLGTKARRKESVDS